MLHEDEPPSHSLSLRENYSSQHYAEKVEVHTYGQAPPTYSPSSKAEERVSYGEHHEEEKYYSPPSLPYSPPSPTLRQRGRAELSKLSRIWSKVTKKAGIKLKKKIKKPSKSKTKTKKKSKKIL